MTHLKTVFDAFLEEYPLCYGYWKKYADASAKAGDSNGAIAVYEKGVQAIPFCIDLWGHFIAFAKGYISDPDSIRK